MKTTVAAKVRNFAIAGHAGSGKTSLADLMLYKSGKVNRLGSVADKTSFSDYREDEQEKRSSIYATPLCCEWNDNELYFIDTPGNSEFFGETKAALSVVDLALIVVDAQSGIEFGTSRAWKLAQQRNCPRAIFINSMDRDNVNYARVLDQIQQAYGATVCIPMTLPIGEGPALQSVVHVLRSREIPDSVADLVQQYRSTLMDTVAEQDEALMTRYLDGDELSEEEISEGLHHAILDGSLVPVFCGSVLKDIGVTELLNGVVNLFPHAIYHDHLAVQDGEIALADSGPGLAHVFKTVIDAFGQLSLMRVYSGRIKSDSVLHNDTRNSEERIGTIVVLNGRDQEKMAEAGPGMIIGVPKLKDTHVNDTVSSARTPVRFKPIEFPTANMSYAVYATRSGEEEKIHTGLQRLTEEDPTVRVERNAETHELLIYGLGDQHLRAFIHRLEITTKVKVDLRTPKVPYRETITAVGTGMYRHKKQTGGHGQFAEVHMRVEPLHGSDFEFASEVVGGAIPRNYIPACEKGVLSAMAKGPLSACRVANVKAIVTDGKYHDVDSSDMAFQIAARAAFKDAFAKANPMLLEPVMRLRIIVPEQYMGDITGDLSHHRAQVVGMGQEDGMQVIEADMPLAESLSYATMLKSLTQGRGTYEVAFGDYRQVPPQVAQKIIAEAKHDPEEH